MQVPPFSLSKQLSGLADELDAAALKVLHSGQFIGGTEVKAFEDSFSDFVGVPFVVGCNSGTDALILALRALEIGPGDQVITTSFSFFATAEAISSVGALPVFVDIDSSNYLIDLGCIEAAITSSTKAIIPVHLFGCPVNMEALGLIAKRHNLKIIEDCAQAAGSRWGDIPVGGWGDVGCFSFFPTKNLGAAGDAGAVTTKDSLLAQKIRELAIHGMPKRYLHSDLGYNSRLDAVQAAVLNVKLPNLERWIVKRESIAKRYLELLSDIKVIQLPEFGDQPARRHSWNQFVIKIKINNEYFVNSSSLSARDWLKNKLEELGVNTIIYYPIPIHLQPAYKDKAPSRVSLPVTESICEEVLSLPMFPEITTDEQSYVVSSLKSIIEK